MKNNPLLGLIEYWLYYWMWFCGFWDFPENSYNVQINQKVTKLFSSFGEKQNKKQKNKETKQY